MIKALTTASGGSHAVSRDQFATPTQDVRRSNSATTTKTNKPASTTGYPGVLLPGRECVRSGSGEYAAAAAGSDITSCPFAINVRKAYLAAAKNGEEVRIVVYSPVTKKKYTMTCVGDQPVECTGGNNAVVYLYGGVAKFVE